MKTNVSLKGTVTIVEEDIIGLNIIRVEFYTPDNYHILERSVVDDELVWRISHIEEEAFYGCYEIKWEVISEEDATEIINIVHPFTLADLFDSYEQVALPRELHLV